jgi:Vanillate O-demethylase oxygenase C-terminal domain
VTASIHRSVVEAFEEDRSMISAQAARLASYADFQMHGISADEALVKFRRLVDAMIKAEQSKLNAADKHPSAHAGG